MRTNSNYRYIALGILLGFQSSIYAAPPSLTGTSPAGLARGKTVDLTFQGASLAGMPEIISNLPLQYSKAENKDAAKWTVKVTLPADAPLGVFPVRVVSAKGVSNPVLISVDQVPTVMEVEPNTTFEKAQAVPSPVVVEGACAKNDVDYFRFSGRKGQQIVLDAAAARIGSALDPTIRLTTLTGKKFVASADDAPFKVPNPPANTPPFTQPDPELEFTVPAGQTQATLVINDISKRGGLGFHYRIYIEKSVPDFELAYATPQIGLPVGQSVLVNFTVDRKRGYAGPIRLELVNPPAGVKFRPGVIRAGGVAGSMSISLDAGAKLPLTYLNVVGKGDGGVNANAQGSIVFARQGPLPVNILYQDGLLSNLAEAAPVGLMTPETAIEVAHGFEGSFPLKLTRTAGGEPALELALVNPPAGLTLPGNKVAEKVADFAVVLKAAVEVPIGEHIIGLTAKGKLAGEDRVVDAPVIKLNVVAPIVLEGVPKELSVKAGQTVELKGKLNRKPSAKAEVTLTIDTLPAGLKADPVKVAGDKSDFTIKITADKAAKVAMGNATVKAAFKAGDKDYPALTAPVAVKIVP